MVPDTIGQTLKHGAVGRAGENVTMQIGYIKQ
jgi:hypothetical protein